MRITSKILLGMVVLLCIYPQASVVAALAICFIIHCICVTLGIGDPPDPDQPRSFAPVRAPTFALLDDVKRSIGSNVQHHRTTVSGVQQRHASVAVPLHDQWMRMTKATQPRSGCDGERGMQFRNECMA